jgi:hypothetical protein
MTSKLKENLELAQRLCDYDKVVEALKSNYEEEYIPSLPENHFKWPENLPKIGKVITGN